MDKHVKDCLEMIELNAQLSLGKANNILGYPTSDMYIKHQAVDVKSKAEDTLRMVESLRKLLTTQTP